MSFRWNDPKFRPICFARCSCITFRIWAIRHRKSGKWVVVFGGTKWEQKVYLNYQCLHIGSTRIDHSRSWTQDFPKHKLLQPEVPAEQRSLLTRALAETLDRCVTHYEDLGFDSHSSEKSVWNQLTPGQKAWTTTVLYLTIVIYKKNIKTRLINVVKTCQNHSHFSIILECWRLLATILWSQPGQNYTLRPLSSVGALSVLKAGTAGTAGTTPFEPLGRSLTCHGSPLLFF